MKKYLEQIKNTCEDFLLFCQYVSSSENKLSGRTGNISKKDCFELNKHMQHTEQNARESYSMERYPVLRFMYYIAFEYDILTETGNKVKEGNNYGTFFGSSSAVQYLFLLTNLLFGGARKPDERDTYSRRAQKLLYEIAKKQAECGSDREKAVVISLYVDEADIALYEEFGLADVLDADAAGAIGRELELQSNELAAYLSGMFREIELDDEKWQAEETVYHYLREYLTYRGEDPNGPIPDMWDTEASEGPSETYELEVAMRYHACSRTIQMPAKNSLDYLHCLIQKAFDFDDDHLYAFYAGRGVMRKNYVPGSPTYGIDIDKTDFITEETSIGDMRLKKGSKFQYLFDFGDYWWFDITVKAIIPEQVESSVITDYRGEAPKQYPDIEDNYSYVSITKELTARDIMDACSADEIALMHQALYEKRISNGMVSPDVEKQKDWIEDMVFRQSEIMIQFLPLSIRKFLDHCMNGGEWVDKEDLDILSKLSPAGFCRVDRKAAQVLIPYQICDEYREELRRSRDKLLTDEIMKLSEAYLNRCGVIELSVLYEMLYKMSKKKFTAHEFRWWVYSHMVFWKGYGVWSIGSTEYLSLYEEMLTNKILDARQQFPGDTYPVLTKKELLDTGKRKGVREEWRTYICFDLSLDYDAAMELTDGIPRLIASGVVTEEEVIETYAARIQKAGSRKKKAERLIRKLFEELPLAAHKGKLADEKPEKPKKKKDDEAYSQMSLFDM